MKQTAIIKMIWKDKTLSPINKAEEIKLKNYLSGVKHGTEVEVYYFTMDDNEKSLAQLKKVHAMIREIASFTGHTFSEVKEEIKDLCGYYTVVDNKGSKQYKSFSECTKEEISKAIEQCILVGNAIGYQLD